MSHPRSFAPLRTTGGSWRFARRCSLALLVACGGSSGTPTPPATPGPTPPAAFPLTGQAVPGMASVDQVISALMQRWEIPGGAVAVVKDGRLVYARGFGYADVAARESVEPDALFRVASVAKPVTAVAVMKLVEEGRLGLDARAFALRPDLTPPPGATADPRVAAITVRHLLTHSAGWDREASFDPMFRTTEAANALGVPLPAGTDAVIRYALGRPLDFDPGARYAYSNLGYAVLGRVIDRASGQGYEQYVRQAVLAPMGITRMRLGASLASGRAPGEVRYYDAGTLPSVFPSTPGAVPAPYGGFHLEAMDAHGGWIASAVDLMRFVTATDRLATRPDLLRSATVDTMTARPAPLWDGSPFYYALGWLVRPAEGNWWHDGSLPGTASIVVRTGTGLAWAAVFNARAMRPNSTFQQEIDGAMWQAVRGVTEWPAHDLFARYQ